MGLYKSCQKSHYLISVSLQTRNISFKDFFPAPINSASRHKNHSSRSFNPFWLHHPHGAYQLYLPSSHSNSWVFENNGLLQPIHMVMKPKWSFKRSVGKKKPNSPVMISKGFAQNPLSKVWSMHHQFTNLIKTISWRRKTIKSLEGRYK